jgi:hypothetical protein
MDVDRNTRLEQLRNWVEDEDTSIHPTDLVEGWGCWAPRLEHDYIETTVGFVDVDRVVGTHPINEDRCVERRLVKIVNKMAEGVWEAESEPVNLNRRPSDGQLFVGSDGNHRVLAHKFFGYDEIYAEVNWYE